MKKLIALTLLFFCWPALAQQKKLPQQILSAFENKYPEAELDNWTFVGDLYYVDFQLISKSYKSIFDEKGVWIETSESISELDIPIELVDFIGDEFGESLISSCEKVETPAQELIRVSLYSSDEFYVLQCNVDGSDIRVILQDP